MVAVAVMTVHSRANQGALLVLNKSESTLAIIDPATLKVLARVPTGEAPHEVAASADGRLAFVSNYGTADRPGNTISVIDIAARKELKRVDLSPLIRPHGITESNGKIYFTVEGSRAVARYDPVAGRVDWIMGTGQAGTHMVVVARGSGKLYTPNTGSETVTSIEPGKSQTGQAVWRVTQIGVGKAPEGIDLSPDERELWVAHRQDGGLSIIDTATDKVKEAIIVGSGPIRVKFTPDGKRVLVSNSQGGEVVVYEAATRKELKRIQVGGVPVGIVIQPDGRRAFVASTQANKVSVINLDDLSVAGTIEPGREPDGMAWAK
jgi:YVTN family beta-propeller protein